MTLFPWILDTGLTVIFRCKISLTSCSIGYSNVGVYFSISLGLGHKGFHRKLHLTTLLFNLYLGSILRNTYLPLKLCMSLGNLYIYMYIETERCTVLHFDINVVRYFLFTCSGKTSDYNIKF